MNISIYRERGFIGMITSNPSNPTMAGYERKAQESGRVVAQVREAGCLNLSSTYTGTPKKQELTPVKE